VVGKAGEVRRAGRVVWEARRKLEIPPGLDPVRLVEAAKQELARRYLLDFIQYVFPGYVPGKVHRFVCAKLEQFEEDVRQKRRPRLMLFLPPRSGKSEIVSRKYPAWILGRNPDWSIILTSYGADLSEELSGDCRDTVQSEEYAQLFGRMSTEDISEAVELNKGRKGVQAWRLARKRGGVRAVGVGGAITGRGADILIIDDPVKNRKEADSETVREDAWNWYRSTARTRLEPGGGIVLLMTRWHHDDLAGRLLRQAKEDPKADQWEVIQLPAIAEEDDPLGRKPGEALDPGRFDLEALEQLKSTVGSREWISLYQQKPTPDEGAIFKRDQFILADPRSEPPLATYQFWDTAFSQRRQADYSVGGTVKVYRDRFRLDDVIYGRWEFPELKRKARQFYELHRPRAVFIEDIGSGKSLVQEFRRETRLPILTYKPDRDKVARAHAATPLIEAGKLELPRNASWLEWFFEQVLRFPNFEHDDAVDMLTMALICLGVRDIRSQSVLRVRDFKVVA
jgi:predicted phage terminase large subunit-like protein